jgi:hypothetical protein
MRRRTEMDHNDAAKDLKVIRSIMESSSKYTLLPGIPAIIGGCLVLVAALITYVTTRSPCLADLLKDRAALDPIVGLWVGAALLALLIDIVWAAVIALRRGVNPFGRMARVAAYALGPPFVAGAAVCIYHLAKLNLNEVAAYSMVFYGLGLWSASLFSTRSPKLLGAAFVATGLATLWVLSEYSLVASASSFGGFHVAFGVYVLARFGE